MSDIPEYLIKDFGNEYVIYRNAEEQFTCWSPEDAERIASLMFTLDVLRDALWLIHENKPQDYCADAFKPEELYDNVHEVAHHAWSMSYMSDGMFMWEVPCAECEGAGCKDCKQTGGIKQPSRAVPE